MDKEEMTQNGRAAIETIKELFERGVPVDLYLPDGEWSGGRPGENQMDLKAATSLPGKLICKLSDGFRLTVLGEAVSVRPIVTKVRNDDGTPAVEISGFKELIYRTRLRERRYSEGVAMFVGGGYRSFQVETIMKFFEQGVAVDLYLPDADRAAGASPTKTNVTLSSVSQRSADITVELNDGYSLTFRGEAGDAPSVPQIARTVIEITEFEKLTYRYPGGTTTYDEGVVTFVAGGLKQHEGTPS